MTLITKMMKPDSSVLKTFVPHQNLVNKSLFILESYFMLKIKFK